MRADILNKHKAVLSAHTHTLTHTAGFDRIASAQHKHRHADRQAANKETDFVNGRGGED